MPRTSWREQGLRFKVYRPWPTDGDSSCHGTWPTRHAAMPLPALVDFG